MLKIRYWRKKRGLALKALQAKTGIPYQTLSNYERGTVDPPTGRLMVIADALDIPVGALFPRRIRHRRRSKHDDLHPQMVPSFPLSNGAHDG